MLQSTYINHPGATLLTLTKNSEQRCEICLNGTDPEHMLLCDACDGGYHTYCLRPKVTVVPHGNWYIAHGPR